MNPLKHVAIIMDGNGRWGLKYKNSRNAGHKSGLKTVEKIIKETIKNKISYLTLLAFSTENWKRPQEEISYLFILGAGTFTLFDLIGPQVMLSALLLSFAYYFMANKRSI